MGVGKLVTSPKSKLWQPGLTGCLFFLSYLIGTTQSIGSFEYEFLLYILHLLPTNRELLELSSINLAPQSAVIILYGFLLAIFIIKYWRRRTTAISILVVCIIFF